MFSGIITLDICVFSDVLSLNIYANNYSMVTLPQRMAYLRLRWLVHIST